MSGSQMALLIGASGFGGLSATMTASGTSGNVSGFNTSASVGSLSAAALAVFGQVVNLYDDTVANQLVLSISTSFGQPDPQATTLGSITMNSLTFLAGNATFTGSVGLGTWKWANGGVRVTGAGRAFVIT